MSAEMFLGLVFALSSMAVALVEARRFSAEREHAERLAGLEHRTRTLEERLQWTQDRVDALEQAAREDPHRRRTK